MQGLDNKVLRAYQSSGGTWSVQKDYVYATSAVQDAERMKFTGHDRDLANTGSAADDQSVQERREPQMKSSPHVSRALGLAFCISVLGCQSVQQHDVDASERVDGFCQVVGEPESFNGRLIEIEVTTSIDLHYTMSLDNEKCPEYSIVLVVPNEFEEQEPYSTETLYQRTIESSAQGLPQVRVTLEGRFEWTPEQFPNRILYLTRIVAMDDP